MKGIKSRSYTVTIHTGHATAPAAGPGAEQPPAARGGDSIAPLPIFDDSLLSLCEAYDDGKIDYLIISAEISKKGTPHLQGFVIFNEEFGALPTELLAGSWTKARSLSSARDYCAQRGIFIEKEGVEFILEAGQWVDPGFNQHLRARLSYEFGTRLKAGDSIENLTKDNPGGVLLVGIANLNGVQEKLRSDTISDGANFEPYYYIGFSHLEDCLKSERSWLDFSATAERWVQLNSEEE